MVSSPVIRISPADFVTDRVREQRHKQVASHQSPERRAAVGDRDDAAHCGASDTPSRGPRLIERVKQGLETSDGRPLWEVMCGHIGRPYLTLNSVREMVCAVAGRGRNAVGMAS